MKERDEQQEEEDDEKTMAAFQHSPDFSVVLRRPLCVEAGVRVMMTDHKQLPIEAQSKIKSNNKLQPIRVMKMKSKQKMALRGIT